MPNNISVATILFIMIYLLVRVFKVNSRIADKRYYVSSCAIKLLLGKSRMNIVFQ